MSKPVNKTLIGAFILGAVALAVIGIIALGGGSLFRKTGQYVMYFTGSVKGLSVGAPVQLKGVPMGSVTEIHLVFDTHSDSLLTEVLFQVPEGSVKTTGGPGVDGPQKKRLSTETNIEAMIENGLRAKLQLQSFVTGQLLVAFDFYPNSPIVMMGLGGDILELPTLPSDMDALTRTLDSIDVEAIAASVNNVIQGFEALINAPELKDAISTLNLALKDYRRLAVNLNHHIAELSRELTATLADGRHLIQTADNQVTPIATGFTATTDDLRKTIARLDKGLQPVLANAEKTTVAARDAFQQAEIMLANLKHLTDPDSPMLYQLDKTLVESRKAFRTLALLADYLSRHPEALLQGKKGGKEER